MKEAGGNTSGGESLRPYILAWLVACAILISASLNSIRELTFPDPDDTLRLLQVRDWLAGQSWFDVRQYRMNAPEGAPMHWSRLVDVPIAAVILLLRPLIGTAAAEIGALIIVPLLTLGVVMALVAAVSRKLLDREHAILAAFIVPVSVVVTHQLRPMRIDHHGWQMALAMGALLAALDPNRRRSGLVSGALAAIWLSISLEGLPFAAALGALAAVRWLLDPRESKRLVATTASLAAGSLFLFAATKTGSAWSEVHCDAVSPPHLAVLALGALGCVGLTRAGSLPLQWKLSGLAILGAAVLGAMMAMAPQCAEGPFQRLDPLVYNFWYVNVKEGLPVWEAGAGIAADTMIFPLIGLAGTVLCLRRSEGAGRQRWAVVLFLLLAAIATTLFVQRAGSVAHLFAIPGAVFLLKAALRRAQELRHAFLKIAAMVASLAIVAPSHAITAGVLIASDRQKPVKLSRARSCLERGDLAALDLLPSGDVAAPLDISPHILVLTRHRVVASGHHRNDKAMADVIRIFTSTPEAARPRLERRSIDYVVVCPGLPETKLYAAYGPAGLWSELSGGRTPGWLEPVKIPGVKRLLIWRVKREG